MGNFEDTIYQNESNIVNQNESHNINKNDIKNHLIKCCFFISEYEKYLINIYSNLNNNYFQHRGYLIDRKKYEEYKKELQYDIYIKGENEYQQKINELNSSHNSINIKQFEQVEFKSPEDLLDKLLNNNEYIFINTTLWQSICINGKENEDYIKYYINNSDLYFSLNNKNIYFKHNNNILNSNSYNFEKNEIVL